MSLGNAKNKSGLGEGILLFIRTYIFNTFFGICFAVFAFILLVYFYVPLQDAFEDWNYAHYPSADLAYAYGERHFQAMTPSQYDVNRAEKFFYLAAHENPKLPYVYHELARISFLRGDFVKAMAQINTQINNQGDSTPNSYYVRGLIEGFLGDYDHSIEDYKYFLKFDPQDWAGINDCAWVMLKAHRPQDAADLTAGGLQYLPNNPWLLNTNAIALYQTGNIELARTRIAAAQQRIQLLRDSDWLRAYPGNDPLVAKIGMETFKKAVATNYSVIMAGTSTSSLVE